VIFNGGNNPLTPTTSSMRHSRSFASAFSLRTAAKGGLCLSRKARGHTMLELAFSWLAARPQVASVIAGATRVEQVEQNVKAIGWTLSAEEMAEIDRITKG
jgi:aryl-alcohol dehydrogenase-like predicted oxidoreductase